MPYADRDGHRLYYEQEGSGDPPLVFVHGWCCDHTYFEPQFEHFKATHRVTALDLRGFGRSDPVDGACTIADFADDVAWLCGELELARPVVVGHSMGAAIAIELAARHPSLPAAVVGVDPAPIDPPDEVKAGLEGFVGVIESDPDAIAAIRAFVEGFMFIATDDEARKQRIVDDMCATKTPLAAAAMRGILEWDGAAALRACTVPTLILLAGFAANDPAQLVALKPDVQIGITVGAGHFHQLEVPEQVTPMIERFVRVALRDRVNEPA